MARCCPQVPVGLLINTRTSSIVWGLVPPAPALCSSVPPTEELSVVVGVTTLVTFTACDDEFLPVAHGLPRTNPPDNRRFTASLSSGKEVPSPVYARQGIYEVAVQVETHGNHDLTIYLNSTAAGLLSIRATCPTVGQTAALSTGDIPFFQMHSL